MEREERHVQRRRENVDDNSKDGCDMTAVLKKVSAMFEKRQGNHIPRTFPLLGKLMF